MTISRAAVYIAALVLFAAASACGGNDSAPASPSPNTATVTLSPTVSATATPVEESEPPDRDLIDLARRFRGLPADAPRLARDAPYGYAVGDREEFSLLDLQDPHVITIGASVAAVTEHAYFFLEDGVEVSNGTLERITSDFEEIVYPRVTGAFGSEWTPGVDSDPRITLLHANLRGAGGYFSGSDEFPTAVVPRSNEREMLYLASGALKSPGDGYNALAAHELQHLIHWQADSEEDSWVNEGLSQVAAQLVLGGATGRHNEFLQSPDTQLTFWPAIESSSVHYAAAELFFSYLLDHYGERVNASKLIGREGDSIVGVSQYLADYDVSFEDVFADWVVANYLDENEGRYAHLTAGAVIEIATTIRQVGEGPGTVHQFAADYLEVEPPDGGGTLALDGADEVSMGIPEVDGPFWWSNRGDGIDSRLTREFDLTGLARATLRFSTWFDIEEGWDYAHVAVSTDGGNSWQALPGRHTSDYDPVEAAYGPGYTGRSNGWLQEEIDLTTYVGRKTLVRFEYVTDDASSLTGFAIDGIQVPEVGPGDDGWMAEGFRLIEGPLEQGFVVQVIEGGDSPQVRRVTMDAENRVEIRLDGPATVVVAAVTEGTAEVAPYTWSLRAL